MENSMTIQFNEIKRIGRLLQQVTLLTILLAPVAFVIVLSMKRLTI